MSLKWNDLSILTKIMICVGALIAVSGFVSFRAVDGIGRITSSSAEASAFDTLVENLLQREIDHLKWVQAVSIFVHDPQAQKLTVQADPAKCAFGEWYYGEGRRTAEQRIPEMRDLAGEIEAPHRALHESALRIAAARSQGAQDQAEALFKDSSLPALGQVQEILKGMRKLVQEHSDAKTKDLADTGSQVRSSVVLFTGVSIAAGLLLGTLAALSISRPLKRGVRSALAIAAGDLDQDLDARRKDEVGRFCAALAAVRDAVKSVLAEYDAIVRGVEVGDFLRRGDPGAFKGGFAQLIAGGNRIADIFVGHLDSIPSPVMTIDREFTVLYMNQAGQKAAGNAAVGRKCHELFRTSDCKTDQCACGRAMREAKAATSQTDAHPQGLDLDISYTGSPIRDRSGAVAGALEIVTDQTAVMTTRRKMQRYADDAMGISHQVSAAAEQLSAQAAQSSRGAELEAQRLSETATAMEEMNATVLEVARSAAHSSESSDQARSKAQEGAAIVSDMVAAINDVQRRTADLKANMSELGKKAEGIGAVMNVINDIADQTNLLALNAAIEAARAGDAGRGFAVVADEVRKLAEKTMAATKEVGEAITGIQHETRSNIDTVEASARIIESATALANKSGQSLEEIVKLVEVASDQVRSIATASEEQSAASGEINRAVEEISRIAAETSSAMQQSAQAVTELSSQAQRLNRLIDELREAGGK